MYTSLLVVCLGLLSAQLVNADKQETVGNVATDDQLDANSISRELIMSKSKLLNAYIIRINHRFVLIFRLSS